MRTASLLTLSLLLPSVAAPSKSEPRGQELFQSRCSGCHGRNGRGGEHGPDIIGNRAVQGLPDRALFRTIQEGVPRAGMPAFKQLLGPEQIRALVMFIRSSGQAAAPAKAEAVLRGKQLFFGKAGCAMCHIMGGKGGFLGSDLSEYGRSHSPVEAREAILHPGRNATSAGGMVTLSTRSGQHFSGVVRSEDNFSIQVLDAKGVFHLLMKSEIAELRRESTPVMPDDYARRLNSAELDSVVTYIEHGDRVLPVSALPK